jgi:hypothetical protein
MAFSLASTVLTTRITKFNVEFGEFTDIDNFAEIENLDKLIMKLETDDNETDKQVKYMCVVFISL